MRLSEISACVAAVSLGGVLAAASAQVYRPDDEALARASWWTPFGPAWFVTVWKDGTVRVVNHKRPHKGGRYQLGRKQQSAFEVLLQRERPWEIQGGMGDLLVDGPERHISVNVDGHQSTFTLYTTPTGVSALYRNDSTQLSRALRVCEALYAMAGDETLPGCVDDRAG